MYITVSSIKRNLGFKGLEISDLIIAFPFIILFLIFFCFTRLKIFGLTILIVGVFMLIPVKVSQKNRMYKVLLLVGSYLFSIREFTYFKTTKRKGMMLFDKIQDKRRKREKSYFKV